MQTAPRLAHLALASLFAASAGACGDEMASTRTNDTSTSDASTSTSDASTSTNDASTSANDTSTSSDDASTSTSDASTSANDATATGDTGAPRFEPGATASVRVPSAAAPETGLLVEVRVPRAPRWDDGAPLALILPGSQDTSGIGSALPGVTEVGFVELRAALPGDPASATDGTYDARGASCAEAMADVLAWAAGRAFDADGWRLVDHLGDATPLAGVTGVVGYSNGGNLALSTVALGGAKTADVDFILNWESPVGDGMVDVEAGGNGKTNPAYDPDTGAWDLSALAWSPTLQVGPASGPRFTGGLFFDLDHDGAVDPAGPSPDFVVQPLVAAETGASDARAWWSVRLVEEADRRGLVPDPRPAHVPTAAETRAFWTVRNAENQLATLAAAHPDLLFLVIATAQDHVQGAADHPHVLAQYEGLRSRSVWARLNPDAAYVAAFGSAAGATDNAANAPYDHASIRAALEPEAIPLGVEAMAAAAELADRAHAGVRDAQLAGVIAAPPAHGCAKAAAGATAITHVESDGRAIAVKLTLPAAARYADGAPVVVNLGVFFTQDGQGFYSDLAAPEVGAIHVAYLWPGRTDAATGAASEGTFDYGGPTDIAALRDVIRFATGELADVDGCTLADLSAVPPLVDDVGLYGFSHPGIGGVLAMSEHGAAFPRLAWFVGRENPTAPAVSAMELGHFDESATPAVAVGNSLGYAFPADYAADALAVHYADLQWTTTTQAECAGRGVTQVPSFPAAAGRYVMGCKIPTMYGKRYYSGALLTALRDQGALSPGAWPADLATPEEATAAWAWRSTPGRYAAIGQSLPGLHAMLVFATRDHVQVAIDKPHVHQAWDGLRAAGIWTRLNPDRAYVAWAMGTDGAGFPDHVANSEPASWADARPLAYPVGGPANALVPLAAVAEMADRTHANSWATNLTAVLTAAPAPTP